MSSKKDIQEFFKSSVFSLHGAEIGRAQVGDRIYYAQLLTNGFRLIQMLKANQDHEGADSATEMLVNLVPKSWKTDDFHKEVDAAIYKVEETTYATFCGVPYGAPATYTVEQTDYSALLGAVINLLDDLGMLSKKIATEVIPADTPIKEYEKMVQEAEDMDAEKKNIE